MSLVIHVAVRGITIVSSPYLNFGFLSSNHCRDVVISVGMSCLLVESISSHLTQLMKTPTAKQLMKGPDL
jgi:hypothetical protein